MPSRNDKENSGHNHSWLKKQMKSLMVLVIGFIGGVLGGTTKDELVPVIKESVFYGELEMVTEDSGLMNYGRVTVYDGKGSAQRRFQLSSRRTIKLPAGNYLIEVASPGPDATYIKIMETPIDMATRGHVKVNVRPDLPNAIAVRVTPSKTECVPGEQFSVRVSSTRDGYIWLFAPDSQGNPNQVFPNENFTNNRINAGQVYSIPPAKGALFSLVTRDTPGQELIVGIVTEDNDQAFTYACLKKVVPYTGSKVNVSRQTLWGYDKFIITVRR